MGAAAPTIAFDVVFNREVLGPAGLFFADPHGLARIIEAAEADRDTSRARGLALRDRAETTYNWDDVAAGYSALAARLAAGYRYSPRRGRRNRVVRRAALAGICSLTIVAAIAAWLALKQRDVARTEAATSDRTTQFMVGLFQLADPSENRGNAVTVKEVLDKGAKELREGAGAKTLAREPQVRAELLTAMGKAYAGLGLYTPAVGVLTLARKDAQSTSVPNETRVRTMVVSGFTLYLNGDYEEAAKVLQSAVDIARQSLDATDKLRSDALTDLANVFIQLEKYPEAVQLCNEALVVERKAGPGGGEILSQTLEALGSAYFHSGDLGAAETNFREALQVRTQTFGMHHALTALSLNDLGVVLYQSGRYDEAMSMYQQALPIEREVFGSDHPEVATVLNNIGRAALMSGHIDDAEPVLREALVMTEKFEGSTHDDLVSRLNSLAMIDAYRGLVDAASREIQRADSIARLPDHGELLDQVLLNEADIALANGNPKQAAALLAESKTLLKEAHPDGPANAWRYAVWNVVNAQLLAANGDSTTALATLASAQTILIQRFGPNGFYSLLAKRRIASITNAHKSKGKL